MGKPLIDLPNSFFEEEFLHGARREIMELVRKINAAEDQWALTAYKLESYREALSGSNGDSDEVIVFEFGAGITYLFNFLLIKSHFPQSSLRYIAVDADAMAEMKHHSVYRGNEITYLTGDASKIDWLQVPYLLR